MAYLTCPWCLTPQLVGDESIHYICFTCAAENAFFACTECGYRQTVTKRWTAFTCAKCENKIELPRRWGHSAGTPAMTVEGHGQPWPRF